MQKIIIVTYPEGTDEAGGDVARRAAGGRDCNDHPDDERRGQGRPSCSQPHLPGSPAIVLIACAGFWVSITGFDTQL